ncbi:cysteine-rich CWC family protein [Mycetohabitans sp. B8]|uniref:cysteine-rich CWC family protein n=1 Tax=Mycetohabitans sp. B8 TaxID=2841845 RepID=UPI0034CF952F
MGQRCSCCGEAFVCGADDPGRPCWCANLPPLPARALDSEQDCLCSSCLVNKLARMPVDATAPDGPDRANPVCHSRDCTGSGAS